MAFKRMHMVHQADEEDNGQALLRSVRTGSGHCRLLKWKKKKKEKKRTAQRRPSLVLPQILTVGGNQHDHCLHEQLKKKNSYYLWITCHEPRTVLNDLID